MTLFHRKQRIDTSEARKLCAYVKHILQLSRDIFACARGNSSYIFFALKPAQIFQRLHSKRRMVIVCAEFGRKQNHSKADGPCSKVGLVCFINLINSLLIGGLYEGKL